MKRALLFLISALFIIFSRIVYSEVVIKSLPPDVELKEANILDRVLCYFGVKECIRGYVIYVVDYVSSNASEYVVRGIPVERTFVIEKSKFIVDSSVKLYDYPIRIAIPSAFLTTLGTDRILNINFNPAEYTRTDNPLDIGVPSTFELTFSADNVANTAIILDKFCLRFESRVSATTTLSSSYCISLSPPVNWGPGQTLSAIFKFTNAVHLYWTIGDKVEEHILTLKAIYNVVCRYVGVSGITFYNNSNLYGVCVATGATTSCSFYGNAYAKTVNYCGYDHTVFRVWFYNLGYGGLAIFTTPHQIIYWGESCPSNAVAYNAEYPGTSANGILTCYQCPPNSENPGFYLDRWANSTYPYCKCKTGWKNLDIDNPFNPYTNITYVYDSNGCETQMSCAVDIWATPTSRTILQGGSTTYTINIRNKGNENCTYSLSATCPSGVSCSLSQTSILVNVGETKSVTLTASSNTPGTYTLSVTASSTSPVTGFSNSTSVSLTVQQPTCTVETTISPSTRTITRGGSTTYTVTIRNNGNTQCTYSLVANCPYGVSCSLSSTSVTVSSGSSTSVTLSASSNTPGTYTLSVTASSTSPVTGFTSTASAALIVEEVYTCDVSLVPDSTTKTIEVGQSTQYTITVRNNGNTQCTYTLSSSCPSGVSCSLSHTTVTVSQGGSANVVLTASSNVVGSHILNVSATATQYGGSSRISLTLIVVEGANIPDISITPTYITINKDQEYNFTVYIKNTGRTRTYYLLYADCSGLQCQLSKNNVTIDPGQTVTERLTVVGTAVGEFVINVKAVGPKGEEDTAIAYVVVREEQPPTQPPTQDQEQPPTEPTGNAIPQVYVVPSYLELKEGDRADIFINVKNVGTGPGTFRIYYTCVTGLICQISQDSIYLLPGQEANIMLNVYATTVGEYTITIEVADGRRVSSNVSLKVLPKGVQAVLPISVENILLILIVILAIIIILLLRR